MSYAPVLEAVIWGLIGMGLAMLSVLPMSSLIGFISMGSVGLVYGFCCGTGE